MFSKHQILYSLVLCLLMKSVLTQESPDSAEEYIDEDLPESSADEEQAPPQKPVKDDSKDMKKTNFTEDRFTKLFGPRNGNRNKPMNPFLPKFAEKAKPTLPSFIKRSPPFIKVTPSTIAPAQSQRFNQRTTTTTQRTTTRTPSRGNNGNNVLNNRRNGNGNNRGNQASTTTSSPSTTDSSGRRRFGGGNRRFNTNGTIPATSRPGRN